MRITGTIEIDFDTKSNLSDEQIDKLKKTLNREIGAFNDAVYEMVEGLDSEIISVHPLILNGLEGKI